MTLSGELSVEWAKAVVTQLERAPAIVIEPVNRIGRNSLVWRMRGTRRTFYLTVRRSRRDEEESSLTGRYVRETTAMRAASPHAVPLIATWPEGRAFLTEAVEAVDGLDSPSELFVKRCYESLARIHQIAPPFASTEAAIAAGEEIATHIASIAKRVGCKRGWPKSLGPPVFLHGNANPANVGVRYGDRLCWFDWEDSHCGAAWFDYAYLAGHMSVARNLPPEKSLELAQIVDEELDAECFRDAASIIAAYVGATEPFYHRYGPHGNGQTDEHTR